MNFARISSRLWPHATWLLGLATVLGAFALGSLLGSGVPYQDPTPELAERAARQERWIDAALIAGAGVFLLGVVWALGAALLRRARAGGSREGAPRAGKPERSE